MNLESFENSSEIHEDLAMFFFGCGISFNVVESDYFLNFVLKLNPNYKPPFRETLGGSILDRIYKMIINENYIPKPEKSVLLLDGWKNSDKNEKYVGKE